MTDLGFPEDTFLIGNRLRYIVGFVVANFCALLHKFGKLCLFIDTQIGVRTRLGAVLNPTTNPIFLGSSGNAILSCSLINTNVTLLYRFHCFFHLSVAPLLALSTLYSSFCNPPNTYSLHVLGPLSPGVNFQYIISSFIFCLGKYVICLHRLSTQLSVSF